MNKQKFTNKTQNAAMKLSIALGALMMSNGAFAAGTAGKSEDDVANWFLGWIGNGIFIMIAVFMFLGIMSAGWGVYELRHYKEKRQQGKGIGGELAAIVVGVCLVCFGGFIGWAKYNFESSDYSIGINQDLIKKDTFKLK